MSAPRPTTYVVRPPGGLSNPAEPDLLKSAPRPTTYVVRPPGGLSNPAEPDLLKSAPRPTTHVVRPPGGLSSPAEPDLLKTATLRHAHNTPGFDERVDAAAQRLRTAAVHHAGRIVQASSLGAEDMVITDLVARQRLPVALATLDTGMLHAQTLALIPRIEARYGRVVERWSPPAEAVLHFVRRHGERAMFESVPLRQACCALRKVEPLGRMLEGRSAWITGLRREQSLGRAELPLQAPDEAGRAKLNPLADWSWHDVWHYIALNDVPYNPLHDESFPSIGCAPCTRAVALGEDFRAGRWWWEQDALKECGLHVAAHAHHAAPPELAT